MKKRIITVVGARPQIIKAAALSRTIASSFKEQIEELLIHTGQHYDENMSAVFFDELGIPKPNFQLNVGSGSHGKQTAAMLEQMEEIFLAEKPDAVVLYGDTNSTIAGSLAAVKLHIPVVHIEAGLRSFNKKMPEEINRISTDHCSTLLFSPTQAGVNNLRREGFEETAGMASLDAPKVYHCGDIMYDNSLHFSEIASEKSNVLGSLNIDPNRYILATVHRPSNTDKAENLSSIIRAFIEIGKSSGLKIVFPIHPRTKGLIGAVLEGNTKTEYEKYITETSPVSFLDMIQMEKNAALVMTDSGGVQKEAYFFQKPCVILREQTEWIEIVETGSAILTGASYEKIMAAYMSLTEKDLSFPNIFGEGKAANFILDKIISDL